MPNLAPPLPPPPARVCKDRQPSAYETDVDCGGVCGPCEVEQSCRDAGDCTSGLCQANVCKERIYEAGTPIPPGYHLEPSTSDRASTARLAGISFFAVSYGAAYVAALTTPSSLSLMFVPLVGPWLLLDDAKDFAPEGRVGMTKVLLVADGALQVAGALLWVGGSLGREQQLLRTPAAETPQTSKVWVSPAIGRNGYSVNVAGLF
ncbi:MAG TPA: hypothetical protein VFU02_16370 [Polyangiaceae bacterium]|nr:hypothetical protein [Polyangiaceae bacterium]